MGRESQTSLDQDGSGRWLQIMLQEQFRSQISKYAFPLIITVAFVYVLVSQIQFDDLILERLSWIWLIPVALGICCSYFARASFFSKSLRELHTDFMGLFLVTGVYSWISVFFPFGLGHLSYPYFLEKYYGIKLSAGVSSLIGYNAIRVFILAGITLWAFLSLDLSAPDFPIVVHWDHIVIMASLLVGVIFIGTLWRNVILEKLGRIGEFFRSVLQSLLKTLTSKEMGPLLFVAAIADLFNIAVFYFAFLFAGCSLPLLGVALVFGLANLSVLLPIHGIGNLGSLEAILTLVLVGLGQPVNEAVQVSFAVHIVQLAVRTVIGLVCYSLLK